MRFCHWMTNIIEQGLPWGVNGLWKTNIIEQGPPSEFNGRRITNIIEQGPPSEVHGHGITNIIDQCPHWEVYSCPVDQEIPCVLWKMDVHYRVHNSSLLVPVLSLVSPVHSLKRNFFSKWFTRGPASWLGGQSSWLLTKRSRVRFPALPCAFFLERGRRPWWPWSGSVMGKLRPT